MRDTVFDISEKYEFQSEKMPKLMLNNINKFIEFTWNIFNILLRYNIASWLFNIWNN